MDEDFARHIVKTTFRSSSMLADLVPLITEHCEDTELAEKLKKSLATIIADASLEINNEIFSLYPELEQEIESSLKKYGFLIR